MGDHGQAELQLCSDVPATAACLGAGHPDGTPRPDLTATPQTVLVTDITDTSPAHRGTSEPGSGTAESSTGQSWPKRAGGAAALVHSTGIFAQEGALKDKKCQNISPCEQWGLSNCKT